MTIQLAILLAVIILFMLKVIELTIGYFELWDIIFYGLVIILITILILILTAPPDTFT